MTRFTIVKFVISNIFAHRIGRLNLAIFYGIKINVKLINCFYAVEFQLGVNMLSGFSSKFTPGITKDHPFLSPANAIKARSKALDKLKNHQLLIDTYTYGSDSLEKQCRTVICPDADGKPYKVFAIDINNPR